MKVKNTSKSAMDQALKEVNKKFDGNIVFLFIESTNKKGTSFKFRLSVKDSKLAGARRGREGRRISAACWHVHGHFFDALFVESPSAEIRAIDSVINADGGNWIDREIGSHYFPFKHSAACEC